MKKYLKIDPSRFKFGGDLDFLLYQENGAEYVALYLYLCAKATNANGELVSQLGKMDVPLNESTLPQICDHFSRDTISVALRLFKKLELVYEQKNGILKISNFEQIVGFDEER